MESGALLTALSLINVIVIGLLLGLEKGVKRVGTGLVPVQREVNERR